MNQVTEIRLWGKTIGAAAKAEKSDIVIFQYDPEFARSGIEVAPLRMPLSERPYQFPDLPINTFHGLPGLLADSLPDRFGNALINAWLARQGRSDAGFGALERLCYTGSRGMGALEFRPQKGPLQREGSVIEIEALVNLASKILTVRKGIEASFEESSREKAIRDILRVGTSAGGARAKAVIAWNRDTGEVRSGQVDVEKGFSYWLLKFDGVSGNRDKELDDPLGYGVIEYAYSLMAKAAGIKMSETRLMEENKRQHFMTRRFDRLRNGEKLHMQSLCALCHYDFNSAGAYSYEQAFEAIWELGLSMDSIEEQYRRMVFNVVARNQDDHVKNIAFLMDKSGEWSLSPAFDVTYSFNPEGLWTSSHQMTMNGKRDQFLIEDFIQCGKSARMKRGRAEAILNEVIEVVRDWTNYASEAGVPEELAMGIHLAHRFKF